MADNENKPRALIPPPPSLPVQRQSPAAALPTLPSGNSQWITERGRYERNAVTVQAHEKWLRSKEAQASAYVALLRQLEEVYLAHARLRDLPARAAHQHELGKLERANELRRAHLQHEIAEVNLRAELAAAQVRYEQYLPRSADPPPPPPPSPAPVGLSHTEVEEVIRASLPEVSSETLRTLSLLLMGRLAEKKS